MLKPQKLGKTTRLSFSKINEALEMPNLIDVQKKSFEWFCKEGMMEVLRDSSPINDHSGNLSIEFVDFTIEKTPKYSVEECKERDTTYEAPLKVLVRLANKETGEVKQDLIYMGNIPLMTDSGTFVINGAERVIVSQIVRSPGMYYKSLLDKAGNRSYSVAVIPYRGSYLEYETDAQNIVYVKIDKARKLPVTVLVRALGVESDAEILEMFGNEELISATFAKDECAHFAEEDSCTLGEAALKEIYKKQRPGDPPIVESAQQLIKNMFFDSKRYDLATVGRYKYDKKLAVGDRVRGFALTRPVISPITGEVLFEAEHVMSREDCEVLDRAGVNEAYVRDLMGAEVKVFGNGAVLPSAFGLDLSDIGITGKVRYAVLKEILEDAAGDLDAVRELARLRVAELSPKHITKDDIFSSINYLLTLSHGIGQLDDIDHLGNRRLRCVGELLQNQMHIGMSRMEKNIKERMSIHDSEDMTPQSLVNVRPVATTIREFFGGSPLSQFMDQNNPLAELTHKRRLSALGPGGLTRDRAGFEVRDVHYTHYGRICPIETPEGPNIGLISYLATYARINEYGFLEAPYRKVDPETGRVTDEIEYMTAEVEDNYIIAQANEPLDEEGRFVNAKVIARDRADIVEVSRDKIDYMDASPKMVVSVATAMIPFLENDDNTRALMGSNMQKQAVPLMVTDQPYVATGMEYKAAADSGAVVLAKESGVVEFASSDRIVILNDSGTKDTYNLIKFKRSNQGTCVNQRPIVSNGDRVERGEIIADGPATSNGEISLGKNATIAFMTWEGYNYEDAVLLNENLVRNDTYTSIHIEEHSMEARETKLGPQEITREIPNVGEDALKDLDADGIVKIGTEVRSGDILVGKVTPKGEPEPIPEERLLRAIFGEKAREVKDSSLKLPHGESGIVVDVKVFDRSNSTELSPGVNKVVRVYVAQKRKISVGDKMAGRHGNKGVVSRILPPEDMPFLEDGTPVDIVLNPLGVPSRMNIGQVLEVHLGIAAKRLGWKLMTPVFDGANESDIIECLRQAKYVREIRDGENVLGKALFTEVIDENGNKDYQRVDPIYEQDAAALADLRSREHVYVIDGKVTLYDGRTGEPFDNPVTVGVMYYLKLHHLVDDKIHARSNGPYSMVTQQPLGGKAQFGGQRFGEMEVWALEAYGAAYTLQEILTVKSDDVVGRVKTYEAIVKGQNIPTPGIPESFKVLVKELQSLALDVRVLDPDGEEIALTELVDEDDGFTPGPLEDIEITPIREEETPEEEDDVDAEEDEFEAEFADTDLDSLEYTGEGYDLDNE